MKECIQLNDAKICIDGDETSCTLNMEMAEHGVLYNETHLYMNKLELERLIMILTNMHQKMEI